MPETLSTETDPDKNFRHALATLCWHIQCRVYDQDVGPGELLVDVEGRLEKIRAEYVLVAQREHG